MLINVKTRVFKILQKRTQTFKNIDIERPFRSPRGTTRAGGRRASRITKLQRRGPPQRIFAKWQTRKTTIPVGELLERLGGIHREGLGYCLDKQ